MLENIPQEQIQEYIKMGVELLTTYGLRFVGAIAILVIGWTIAGHVGKIVRNACARTERIETTLGNFFASLARYAIIAFTIIAVLGQFGIQTASLIAVLGAAGLAIGLSLQGTLSHLASGVLLLLFRPFKVGDYIEVGGYSGTVENLSLFMTELSMPDGVQILIPNGKVWDQAMKNYSHSPIRRFQVNVGISYDDDIDKAIKAAGKVLESDKRVLKDPAPMIVVGNLGDSSVDIIVRGWANKTDFWDVHFDMHKAVKEGMDKAGIEIPYPQRTMHIIEEKAKK